MLLEILSVNNWDFSRKLTQESRIGLEGTQKELTCNSQTQTWKLVHIYPIQGKYICMNLVPIPSCMVPSIALYDAQYCLVLCPVLPCMVPSIALYGAQYCLVWCPVLSSMVPSIVWYGSQYCLRSLPSVFCLVAESQCSSSSSELQSRIFWAFAFERSERSKAKAWIHSSHIQKWRPVDAGTLRNVTLNLSLLHLSLLHFSSLHLSLLHFSASSNSNIWVVAIVFQLTVEEVILLL